MPWRILISQPVINTMESIVDNTFRDKVKEPKIGSVVYCDLFFGFAEHSGIYIGNNKIVHLNGKGKIEIVNPKEFINNTTAISIYVSCKNDMPVGSEKVAKRAKNMINKKRDYNVLFDNCHQFTSGCLTGDFENYDNFLWMLKDTARKILSCNTWRVWNI